MPTTKKTIVDFLPALKREAFSSIIRKRIREVNRHLKALATKSGKTSVASASTSV